MMSRAFSVGLHNILERLDPLPEGRGFPPHADDLNLRVNPSEHPSEWLRRFTHDHFDGETRAFEVEENLAMFLEFAWSTERILDRMSVQVLAATAGSLRDTGSECSYLRMDLDPLEAGSLWSHPYPHIHAGPDGAPRFPLPLETGNVLIDFLDFVYRSFCPDVWFRWASDVWNHAVAGNQGLPSLSDIAEWMQDVNGQVARCCFSTLVWSGESKTSYVVRSRTCR